MCPGTQKQANPKKKLFFVIENYVEDVKQEEKHVPDLLESIMRPTDPVKEELRQKTMNMSQFRLEITKIRVSTFWRSGKPTDSRWRPMPACSLVSL